MKHEKVYKKILERAKVLLSSKFDGTTIPNDFDFEEAALEALTEAAEGLKVKVKPLGKRKFPDILLEHESDEEKVGVEIKLHTSGELSTTPGNSARASTQEPGLKTIYLLFGNFQKTPPVFESKPYGDCIVDIKITHSPRYMIDMGNESDFCASQLGITFDELRNLEETERIVYVNTYVAKTKYKELSDVPGKKAIVAQGFLLFPEIFSSNPQIRYRRMSVWLFAKGILCRNVRDFISASGKAPVAVVGSTAMPKVFSSLRDCVAEFKSELERMPRAILENSWSEVGNTKTIPDSIKGRIKLWIELVAEQYGGSEKKIPDTPYKFAETLKNILEIKK